tara:strand:- start:5637 stop:6032 length:396 start_codon:yes stop_codon:yes gene_type:complete
MSDTSEEVFSQTDLLRFAQEICGGDRDIFVELLGDCQNDIREQFSNLQKARSEKNWRDFNRAAHSMKSAARTFGSPLVKDLSFKVEQDSADGVDEADLPAIDAKTRELEAAIKKFEDILGQIALAPEPYLI